jgi:hypothetical protein
MKENSISIQPSHPFFPFGQQKIGNFDMSLYIIVNLAVFSTIAVLVCADIPKDWPYLFRFDLSKKIPCRRCQYFTDNQFLKCTVHPVTTMTNQAIDCRDYSPHNQEKRIEQENGSSYRSSWRRIVQNIFHK